MKGSPSRATRVGKRIGSLLATGTSIATGYVWAKHGLLYAFALWGGVLVLCLAVFGALNYPWKDDRG